MTQISNYKYSTRMSFWTLRAGLVFTISSMLSLSPLIAAEASQEKKETAEVELKLSRKKAPTLNLNETQIQPTNINPRSSAEYFSSVPDAKLLVPVHVWGEVKEPGLHFVPMGSSVSEAISASGGPLPTASMPKVNVIKKDNTKDLDLFKVGLSEKVAANDTIVIDRSLKADLPIIFSGVSVLVSVATLIALLVKK